MLYLYLKGIIDKTSIEIDIETSKVLRVDMDKKRWSITYWSRWWCSDLEEIQKRMDEIVAAEQNK